MAGGRKVSESWKRKKVDRGCQDPNTGEDGDNETWDGKGKEGSSRKEK